MSILKRLALIHATAADMYSASPLDIATGTYQYLRLSKGVNVSPDVFQEKISNLMHDLEYVCTYLDVLLVISNGSFEEHLYQLGKVLQRLYRTGLIINVEKSSFLHLKLSTWVTY